MKIARELFEELEYEQTKTEHFIKYTSKVFISDWHHILFDLKEKTFSSYATSDSPFTPNEPLELTVKELQAINKQIEELGWK